MSDSRRGWLYGLSYFGNVLMVQSVGAYALFYYTDVRKLEPLLTAQVMTVYGVYSALNNPVAGWLSDRTRSRWGRRLPYVRFGTLPCALAYALLFLAPFDGRSARLPLAAWMATLLVAWEGLSTLVTTGCNALFPEMFESADERAGASVRMNVLQSLALLLGLALPPVLARWTSWGGVGLLFALLSGLSIYAALPAMFERRGSGTAVQLPLREALVATFGRRSFLAVVASQTFVSFNQSTMAAGMAFFTKYSLGAGEELASLILAAVFVTVGLTIAPWRRFVASRFEVRTTLMLACGVLALASLPMLVVSSLPLVLLTALAMGVGIAGICLTGDLVIMSEVIDEDEYLTGERRQGIFLGMSTLISAMGMALTGVVFGAITSAYRYDPAAAVQPASVAWGFRLLMAVPTSGAAVLGCVALVFYPLHGRYGNAVRAAVAARRRPL